MIPYFKLLMKLDITKLLTYDVDNELYEFSSKVKFYFND